VPARKRRTTARSSRRRIPERAWYLASFFIVLALAVVTLQLRKYSQRHQASATASRRRAGTRGNRRAPATPSVNRNEIAGRYNALLGRVGGESAWIKHAAQPADPGQAAKSIAAATGEVLILASASRAIIAALKHEAASDGLSLTIQPGTAEGAPSGRTVSVWMGREQLCAWRLRKVPRLYRASIIIDDLGKELMPARELLQVPYPLTFSILPNLPASASIAAAAHRSGREVMLHLPMEPFASTGMSPGAGAIRVGMPALEVDRAIDADLESVPYVAGVNNHMGSRATSDPELMAEVMKKLAGRRLYFIDSRTADSTVALEAARRAGIPAFYRSVFLDDTASVDYTLGQLRRLRAVVRTQGVALAIGHPHPTTISALEGFLPSLERDDIELVPASRLVELSASARLSPPHAEPRANEE
jgi:uncharacterized protein